MFTALTRVIVVSLTCLLISACGEMPSPALPERPDDKETSSTNISEPVPTPIDFSASDDGDQYVALEWATMAMPDAQIELQVKDLDADIVGWTSLISLSLDEEYHVHGPVESRLDYRARILRANSTSEWTEVVSIDMRCADNCDVSGTVGDERTDEDVEDGPEDVADVLNPADDDFVVDDEDDDLFDVQEDDDVQPVEDEEDGIVPVIDDLFEEEEEVLEDEDDGYIIEDELLDEEEDFLNEEEDFLNEEEDFFNEEEDFFNDDDGFVEEEEEQAPAVSAPNRPENLAAQLRSDGEIRFTWSAGGGPIQRFILERRRITSEGPTEWRRAARIDGDVRSHTETVNRQAVFQFRLKAKGPGGESRWSNKVRVDNRAPVAPQAVTLTRLNSGKVKIDWEHGGSRVIGFLVQRFKKRNNGEWTGAEEEIQRGVSKRQAKSEPRQSRRYKFCVTAQGLSGNSRAVCRQIDLRN